MRTAIWCTSLLVAAIWGTLTSIDPRLRMLVISVWIFLTLKLAAFDALPRQSTSHNGMVRSLALWVLTIPTLDANAFFSPCPNDKRYSLREWMTAIFSPGLGCLLFLAIAPHCRDVSDLLAGWITAGGLILILHFGLLNLIVLTWRACGRNVIPLMRKPQCSTSLSEFWKSFQS